jgi:hypothetical protein
MYTLAFEDLIGQFYHSKANSIGGYSQVGQYTPKYDIITFPDKKEAWIYVLTTGRKPVKDPAEIDIKKSHFNFSKWDSDNLEIDNHMLNAMKGLSPGDF